MKRKIIRWWYNCCIDNVMSRHICLEIDTETAIFYINYYHEKLKQTHGRYIKRNL